MMTGFPAARSTTFFGSRFMKKGTLESVRFSIPAKFNLVTVFPVCYRPEREIARGHREFKSLGVLWCPGLGTSYPTETTSRDLLFGERRRAALSGIWWDLAGLAGASSAAIKGVVRLSELEGSGLAG